MSVTGTPAIANDPLGRFRLVAVCFAATLAFIGVGIFAFGSTHLEPRLRAVGAVSALLLAAWWISGYRRGGFPRWGWLVDMVLVAVIAMLSPMPLRTVGLFYGGIQLRALYVPHRELVLLPLSYAIARIVSIRFGPADAEFGLMSAPTLVQVIALSIIAVTLHLFVEGTRQHAAMTQALRQSEERYRLVASAMRDVVYDWTPGSGVIDWTESIQHVFGFAPAEVSTRSSWWFDRVHPDDRENLDRGAAAAIADPDADSVTLRYRVRRADERYVHVAALMIIQRDSSGKAERVIGSIRDVTVEEELEEQLRQSQKMEAVGQLAGGVAHDFNNLLTVIGGHVYLLEQGVPRTPLSDKHLAGITRAAERAAMLTKQLLAFSRKQLMVPTVLNMNTVVEDVLQMMRPVIGEHVRIITKLDSARLPVYADPGQIGQVLVNLFLNARDAMPSGGTLTIETGRIVRDAEPGTGGAPDLPAGDYVRLAVSDAGTGMEPAVLARAFEPFYTTKAKGAGSGLGLSTVYGIVKQSAGDIKVSSVVGGGTAFTILLPVTSRLAPERESRPVPAPQREGTATRHGTVLLVEDDDGVRDFAREVLAEAGYRVETASDGVDALDRMETLGTNVDVVVTDVVMPKMGGRELVEHLRRQHPDLPVLYITGYTDDARMLGALYASDVRLLGKPFTAAELERAVAEAGRTPVVASS